MERNKHYQLIAETIQFVAENRSLQPGLEQISAEMGVSPHHLQRTFQSWAGVSPKQFLKFLTRQAALERLENGNSVLESALESGLSGPGRLHDLTVSTEALTPGEIRKRGAGVRFSYGFGETPFGSALISWTPRGINFLGFCNEVGPGQCLTLLTSQWSNAEFEEQPAGAQSWLDKVFENRDRAPIKLWLRGSPFQLKVWQALMAIPDGMHSTYGHLANHIGHPGAARTVGTAIGSNPVAWIIPCHRVIRKVGETGGYRWGELTKKALIGYEVASVTSQVNENSIRHFAAG
jgi:AraC family transcriptional regulator of adaptative response/methylated-DNA-[protein]-cysteine methyltransferase